ncbi:MAG: flagella basal body P-ring formation protein FlgA [Gammaproteobacteria bacterium]|nr:MAG: flagella basal body P-ring formation protein FlgA [Gammaproteobacteria bacterium]
MHRRIFRTTGVLLPIALLVSSAAGFALADEPTIQPIATLSDAARRFAENESAHFGDVEISVRDPDSRLRLQRCDQPLEAFWPPGGRHSGNVSIGVRCTGAKRWKIYLQARISVFEEVAVLALDVARGEVLREDMIRMERQSMHTGNPGIDRPEALIGHRFRNAARAGQLLNARQLEAPLLVDRGETVTLLSGSGGIEVRMHGEALDEGALGSLIRVRNLSSQQIVQGRVMAAGVVRVNG